MGYSRNPSGEVSRMLDALARARFKLNAEKLGLSQKVVVPVADSLDRIYLSLRRIYQDLKNVGL